MPNHEYDAGDALEILGAYAEQKNPSRSMSAKDAAARELLEQLAALDGKKMADFAAKRSENGSVALGFSFADAVVFYSSGRFGVVAEDEQIKVPVPIRFNRGRGIFEGEALDTSRVTVSGEPKEKRRDALAVIAETVVEVFKKIG